YQTVGNVIGNGGYNTNSLVVNPNFISSTNLTPLSNCNSAPRLTSTLTDINNISRNSTTTIGAYEVNPATVDAGVTSITSPTIPFNSGLQNISVVLKNYGLNTITSTNVSYSINGGAPVTASFSGSIPPC